MRSFLEGMSPRRRLRLQATLLASAEYVATCAFLAIYWRLGKADGRLVVAFLIYSVAVNAAFVAAIASGFTERMRDPSITAIQMTVSCGRDLLGCLLMPGLWFIFAFNLFVALPFGSLQFSNRAFAWFWLAVCASLAAIFATYPYRLQIGFDSPAEKALLWLFLSSALARLMLFNARISSLRRKLRAKGAELDQAARRLERERIARDLHDTLLQGIYGVVWRIGALAERLEAEDPVRQQLEAVLDTADRALTDGRNTIAGLRQRTEDQSLAEMLQFSGEELARETRTSFRMTVSGIERPMIDAARVDVGRILQEALLNAFRHSDGRAVVVDLEYGKREVRASVRDNGRGFANTMPDGRSGHFGMSIMRERAAGLGAKLQIHSAPGEGTLVALSLPVRSAYDRSSASSRRLADLIWSLLGVRAREHADAHPRRDDVAR